VKFIQPKVSPTNIRLGCKGFPGIETSATKKDIFPHRHLLADPPVLDDDDVVALGQVGDAVGDEQTGFATQLPVRPYHLGQCYETLTDEISNVSAMFVPDTFFKALMITRKH
jgi:hypothetical protein